MMPFDRPERNQFGSVVRMAPYYVGFRVYVAVLCFCSMEADFLFCVCLLHEIARHHLPNSILVAFHKRMEDAYKHADILCPTE